MTHEEDCLGGICDCDNPIPISRPVTPHDELLAKIDSFKWLLADDKIHELINALRAVVELHKPNQKYLVDYYSYPEWESQAKSDEQMAIVKSLESTKVAQEEDLLFSWLIHYDPLTKSKERVNGYSVYSPNTRELFIKIDDELNHTQDEWTLNVHHCRATGANKPVFVATNVDLNLQH